MAGETSSPHKMLEAREENDNMTINQSIGLSLTSTPHPRYGERICFHPADEAADETDMKESMRGKGMEKECNDVQMN